MLQVASSSFAQKCQHRQSPPFIVYNEAATRALNCACLGRKKAPLLPGRKPFVACISPNEIKATQLTSLCPTFEGYSSLDAGGGGLSLFSALCVI